MAIGAHPDDVEIGCGGTLALLEESGLRVGAVHLTRGEAGTRGSADIRAEEAAAAAATLGMAHEILDLGDGGLRTSREEEDRLIQTLRESKPRIVFVPASPDRHPDHERAHQLAKDCCFYAGLVKRRDPRGLSPHRPQLVLEYPLHHQQPPDLIVDVSRVWQRKLAALRCYASQLTLPEVDESAAAGERPAQRRDSARPETWVASSTFGQSLVGRARHFGAQIGVGYGEAFCSTGPLPLHELSMLTHALAPDPSLSRPDTAEGVGS